MRADASQRAGHDVHARVREGALGAPAAETLGHGGTRVRGRGDPPVTAGTGPVDDAAWRRDPASVLGRLPQRADASAPPAARAGEADRCAAASILGGAIMNGPEATARTLTTAADNPGTVLTSAERDRMRAIAGHVRAGRATFEELGEAQGIMYRAGNTRRMLTDVDLAAMDRAGEVLRGHGWHGAADLATARDTLRSGRALPEGDVARINGLLERGGQSLRLSNDEGNTFALARPGGAADASGMSDGEATSLARRSGPAMARPLGDLEGVADLLDPGRGLHAGQSAILRVDPDSRDSGVDAVHYITVGRDASGRAFIYNPDPGPGDRTLIAGADAEVLRAARGYDGRVQNGPNGEPPSVIITSAPR